MFPFTLSSRPRLTASILALAILLSAVLSSAQPTAASTSRAQTGAPAQQTTTYTLPFVYALLPRTEYDDPHHNYPAIDLEVPTGTRVYAVKGGTVNRIYQADGCGKGIIISGKDGAQYTYCHLNQFVAAEGATISTAELIGFSGNTGRSSGPHLHLQIKVNGVLRCPQPLLLAIYDRTPIPAPSTLPTSGCITS
jgi:murein DD-endopeptidase MepM/ murein hydrolase activator NlpD